MHMTSKQRRINVYATSVRRIGQRMNAKCTECADLKAGLNICCLHAANLVFLATEPIWKTITTTPDAFLLHLS